MYKLIYDFYSFGKSQMFPAYGNTGIKGTKLAALYTQSFSGNKEAIFISLIITNLKR